MAIGRGKSSSKILSLITFIIVVLSLRLLWLSVRNVSTRTNQPIVEPSYYPVEDERMTLEISREPFNVVEDVVAVDGIPVEHSIVDRRGSALENGVGTVLQRTDKSKATEVKSSKPRLANSGEYLVLTPKGTKMTKPQTTTTGFSNNVATPHTHHTSANARNVAGKNKEQQPNNERLSTSLTYPPGYAHIGNDKGADKALVDTLPVPPKATTGTRVSINRLHIKPTNTSRTMVVTDNTQDVIVVTKQQLDYGKTVDDGEKMLESLKATRQRDKTTKGPIATSTKTMNVSPKPKTQHVTKNRAQKNGEPSHVPGFKEVPLEETVSLGRCQKVIPWGQKYHAQISTFDLPKRGNYSLIDEMGNYPLPVKSVAEVTNPKSIEPVSVILVPFSHADPGYGLTIEQYYNRKTHSTLDNMITKLLKYPKLTFQWAETVYLARWFKDLNEDKKKQVKDLIDRGQLEIVLGGWVMPDEASSRYVGVVDQLIEGHQWLIENLGVKPTNAWVNDPFGYSSTMPYLWKSTGMDNLVFLRINQAVKAQLMKRKSMDFKWRPYWKTDNSSDVLASLMAYTNYWIGDVCSPDRDTCNEFGFIHLDERKHRAIEITEGNLEKQAEKLHGMFRVTVDLYKYNTLYIGLGEDFTYVRGAEWDNLYTNYEKLIDYINSKDEWKMKIKFGNLTEYFNHVKEVEKQRLNKTPPHGLSSESIPTLSGDFYPYTEKNNEYWTGYYTTRPLNKRFSRELESLVHATDVFNVMLFSIFKYYNVKYEGYATVAESLRTARRELGMFLHHDGITGTSLPHVVRDFEWRLMKAHECVQTAFKTVLTTMLTKGSFHFSKLLQEETVKTGPRQITKKVVLQIGAEENKLVLVNPTGRRREELVSVYLNTLNIHIKSAKTSYVPYQTTIVKDQSNNSRMLVTFMVTLPAFGIEVYKVVPLNKEAVANVQERNSDDVLFGADDTFTIENGFMKATFDKNSGMLRQITDKTGKTTNVTSEFFLYQSATSGAYIFGPSGPAVKFSTGKTVVTVTKGPLMSEVKVKSPGFRFSAALYNTTGIQGQGVHIRTEVDMSAIGMKNMEVILRFSTSIKNGPNFFTDQNGYQLMGRQTDYDRKIETNYFPITTMAILEDKHERLTLHTKQPHGAASLEEGQLEVMLDRHTNRDDGRGLGQGVYDNVNVNSDFVLHLEYKENPSILEEVRYTYPTQDAVLVNDALQNNIFIYSVIDNNLKISDKIHPLKDRQVPCDVTIVGLRNLVKNNLEYNGTSLVLHRHSFKCGYQTRSVCDKMDDKMTIKSLFPKLKVGVTETTLSHLHVIMQGDMNIDLKPNHMELRSFKIDIK